MDYDGKLIGKWNKRRNQNEKCSQKLISWEWFKSYILKNPNIRMEQKPWKTIQKKYFPSFARNKNGCKKFYQYLNQFWNENLDPNLPFKIVDDEYGGIKIISKSNNFRDIKEKLIGYLESPPETIGENLKEEKFSSLFSPYEDQVSIMFGPLSLVNHQCNSHAFFSVKPYGNFYKVFLKSSLEDETVFPVGEEVIVTYNKKDMLSFTCKCINCS